MKRHTEKTSTATNERRQVWDQGCHIDWVLDDKCIKHAEKGDHAEKGNHCKDSVRHSG
jgi:hypothetical protein